MLTPPYKLLSLSLSLPPSPSLCSEQVPQIILVDINTTTRGTDSLVDEVEDVFEMLFLFPYRPRLIRCLAGTPGATTRLLWPGAQPRVRRGRYFIRRDSSRGGQRRRNARRGRGCGGRRGFRRGGRRCRADELIGHLARGRAVEVQGLWNVWPPELLLVVLFGKGTKRCNGDNVEALVSTVFSYGMLIQ